MSARIRPWACSMNKCIYHVRAIDTEGAKRFLFSRGLVTKSVVFSVGGARVVLRMLRPRIAKMHNACLRNCQRYVSIHEAVLLHLFVFSTRHAITFLCVYARMNCISGGWMMNRATSDSIRISVRTGMICKTLTRLYFCETTSFGKSEFVNWWREAFVTASRYRDNNARYCRIMEIKCYIAIPFCICNTKNIVVDDAVAETVRFFEPSLAGATV